jgi:hypothetical protein
MKTLHLSIIVLSFALASILSQAAFAQQNTPDGCIHYGPSRQCVPPYSVSAPYNPKLEEQFGNPTKTKIMHDGSILILNQTTTKLVYQSGENISIIPELINIGNKTVDIGYWEPTLKTR